MGMDSFFIKLGFKDFSNTPSEFEIISSLKLQLDMDIQKKNDWYIYENIEILISNEPDNEITVCGLYVDYDNCCIQMWDIARAIHKLKQITYCMIIDYVIPFDQNNCFIPLIKEVYKKNYGSYHDMHLRSLNQNKAFGRFFFARRKTKHAPVQNVEMCADAPQTNKSITCVPILNREVMTFGGKIWYVLAKEKDCVLLILKDILMQGAYHSKSNYATWETSDIREYLNTQFYSMFTYHEQSSIFPVLHNNSDHALYGTKGGSHTYDAVFLLNSDEVGRFFPDMDERTAMYQGELSWWWLRSPGAIHHQYNNAEIVSKNGYIYEKGICITIEKGGIRPALWLKT